MATRILPVVLWSVFALLALYEAAVVVAIANPRVSDAYRAYFIDRTTRCWPDPVSGEIEIGKRVWFLRADADGPARHVLECGWLAPAPSGTWSEGPEARLRLRVPTGSDLNLTFNLIPYIGETHAEQRVEFRANGTPLETLVLDADSERNWTIRVPADSVAPDGTLVVSLLLPDAISPRAAGEGRFDRPLAIRLIFLMVRKAP